MLEYACLTNVRKLEREVIMSDYRIFVDVSCDVDIDYFKAHNVGLVSMEYVVDGKTITYDGTNCDFNEFYKMLKHQLPKTTQISPSKYEELFSPILENGESVLYLCLSTGLSSTYQSALIAKEDLKEKYPNVKFEPYDTRSATCGMTYLVRKAVENKERGLSLEENLENLLDIRFDSNGFAFVDDLIHLKNGGRINTATAVVGNLLGIKPLIYLTTDGTLEMLEMKKGLRKAVQGFTDLYANEADFNSKEPIYISHSANEELALTLRDKIKELNPNAEFIILNISPIIGVHLGQNSLVLFFKNKESAPRRAAPHKK